MAKHIVVWMEAALLAALLFPAVGTLRAGERLNAKPVLEEVLHSLGAQTSFPIAKNDAPFERNDPPSGEGLTLNENMASIILWIALGVFLLFLLPVIRDNLEQTRNPTKRPAPQSAAETAAVRQRMESAGAGADELAASGHFAAAMHALLLQSLAEMRRRLATPFAACLTSREILQRVRLDPEARAALADIVAGVEISHFGAHMPTAEEFAACRARFAVLAASLSRGGTAA